MLLNTNNVKLEFDVETRNLYSGKSLINFSERRIFEMKDVLMDQTIVNEKNREIVLYRMFRNAGAESNMESFESHGIRYDITVLESYDLGGERTKTLGHYHPLSGGSLSFPELYEVISGKALFLLQRPIEGGAFDVKLIEASAGDKVIMPPNYGHITINLGKDLLIMANLVSSRFESEYEPIKKRHGGAIYVLSNGRMLINENYNSICIERKESENISFLDVTESIYDEFVVNPEKFDFLNNPELLSKID